MTTEVVLAEIADITRFNSQKQVVSYAGLAPGQRESAGKSKELHIEKTGSKHLRWIMQKEFQVGWACDQPVRRDLKLLPFRNLTS